MLKYFSYPIIHNLEYNHSNVATQNIFPLHSLMLRPYITSTVYEAVCADQEEDKSGIWENCFEN